jgi:hypothetical protein
MNEGFPGVSVDRYAMARTSEGGQRNLLCDCSARCNLMESLVIARWIVMGMTRASEGRQIGILSWNWDFVG